MDEEPRTAAALQAVVEGRSLDPFAVLGRHRAISGDILRVMVPGAFAVTAIARDEPSLRMTLSPMRNTGLFEAVITHNRYTLIDRSAGPLLEVASQRGLGVSFDQVVAEAHAYAAANAH